MSDQHLEELKLSSISAALFQKGLGATSYKESVVIIDINKFREEGKVKTVSIDSFEKNNLVMVDEAHKGLKGDVWYNYRTRLISNGGFAFEYSATIKQALKTADIKKKEIKERYDDYCRSIIIDYSYKYFGSSLFQVGKAHAGRVRLAPSM